MGYQIKCPVSCGRVQVQPSSATEPLMLRAIRGESVHRPPVWLMRQAGRYMKVGLSEWRFCGEEMAGKYFAQTVLGAWPILKNQRHRHPDISITSTSQSYMDLCSRHRSFRERSENAALATEISLQPWRAFQPDGVILFSDILTPLAGMGIPFDIVPGKGPIIERPIRTMQVMVVVIGWVDGKCRHC